MRAADRTAAHIDWRGEHALDLEIVQAYRRTDDIDDRVDRTDLMEMNLLRRLPVDFALSPRHGLENRQALLPDRR